MKVLVVGGTGMIGCHTVAELQQRGHEVSLAARHEPEPGSPVAGLPVVLGDYARDELQAPQLEGFEGVVFAAGNDIRHVRPEDADDEFWRSVQREGVPRFVAHAKQAGVRRVVQIGSYYHMVDPALAETNPYVRARRDADEGARALADADFDVCTLNPPSIVGMVPGRNTRQFAKQVAWGRGELAGKVPDFAPKGGTNYMSVTSLAEAVAGALENAAPGAAYLVGDQNLSFTDYFQMVFDATGSGRTLEERDEEHPFMPDAFIVQGRGNTISYEPDPAEVALLGYRRDDVRRELQGMVDTVLAAGQTR